jgi:hypothetical protein
VTGALDPLQHFGRTRDVHKRTIVLEDITDVSRYTLKSGRYTSFNAVVAGCEYRGMRVAGWPRLVAGMTVHALLRHAEDFSTLEAWWDPITREVVGLEVNRMGEAAPMLVAAVVLLVVSLVVRTLEVAGAGFLGGTAILFGILGAASLVSEMHNDEVSRALGLLEMRDRRFQFPGCDSVRRALLSPIWRQLFLASVLVLGFVIFFFVFLL